MINPNDPFNNQNNTETQQTQDVNATTNVVDYGKSNAGNNIKVSSKETLSEIAKATVDTAKSGSQTQENDFYTVSQKAYKTAAIASIILPNIQQAQIADTLNKLDFNSDNSANSQYLQKLGASSNVSDQYVNLTVEKKGKVDLSQLSNQQLDSLSNSGSFVTNGITYTAMDNSKPTIQQYSQSYYGHSVNCQTPTNVFVTARNSAAANIETYSAEDFRGITAKGQINLADLSKDVQSEILDSVPSKNSFFYASSDAASVNVIGNPNQITHIREQSTQISGYFAAAAASNSNATKMDALNQLYDRSLQSMSKDANLKSIYDSRVNGPQAVNKETDKVLNRLNQDIHKISKNVHDEDIRKLLSKGQLTNKDLELLYKKIDKTNLSASEKLQLKEFTSSRNDLLGFKNTGIQEAGNILKNNKGLNRLQSNGKRYIANYILGDDITCGYNKIIQTKRTVEFGVHAAYSLTNPIRNTSNDIEKLGAKVLDKINPDLGLTDKLIEKNNKKSQKKREKDERKRNNKNRNTRKDQKYRDKNKKLRTKEEQLLEKERRLQRRLDLMPDGPQKQRLQNKLDRNSRNRDRLFNKRKRYTDKHSKFLNKLNKKPNFIKRSFNQINRIKSTIMKKIVALFSAPHLKAAIIAIGSYLLSVIVKAMLICISVIIFNFCLHFLSTPFSGLEEIKIQNEAANVKKYLIDRNGSINYEQMIADITCNDLAESFTEVCKMDATKYYLNKDETYTSKDFANLGKADADFKSNITDTWYVQPKVGTIGNCWAWEEADNITTWDIGNNPSEKVYKDTYIPITERINQNKQISTASENIVPIFSMMHTRFLDSIEYDNWESALAYTYYMYIVSHDISQYDTSVRGKTINDTHYDDKRDGYAFVYENPCARDSLGSAEYIENSLLSGKRVNRTESSECTNLYIHGINSSLSPNVLAYKTGLTQLFNINEDVFQQTIKQLANEHPIAVGSYTIANDGCWALESTDKFSNSQISAEASEGGGGLTCAGGICTNYAKVKAGSDFTKCGKKEHKHDESCYSCDGNGALNAHVHNSSCGKAPNYKSCTNTLNAHVCGQGGCNTSKLSCTLEEHEHTSDCQIWVAYCKGHCGGHLQPTVDIVEKMTYEGLAQDDGFQTTHFVTAQEVLGDDWTDSTFLMRKLLTTINPIDSIKEWKQYWEKQSNRWFKPYPRSLGGFIKSVDKSFFGIYKKVNNSSSDTEEDINQFCGWWKSPGVLNEDYIDLMEDFYGKFYNPSDDPNPEDDRKYDMAKAAWSQFEEFGVEFHTGFGKTLSDAEIEEYLKVFKAAGCNQTQLKILEEALKRVGLFTYSCTGTGHMNGLKGIGGLSECSGFVGGVLNAAFGFDGKNWGSAADFAHMGTSFNANTCQPGMVVAHANGGSGFTGHVMIYAGYMQNGPDGPGYYTVECTNSKGVNGSQLKKRDLGYLQKCNQVSISG